MGVDEQTWTKCPTCGKGSDLFVDGDCPDCNPDGDCPYDNPVKSTNVVGYCPDCRRFYPDKHEPFGSCPIWQRGYAKHRLLHETKCQGCETRLYFQTDDDYCGPDGTIICGVCAGKEAEPR